MRRALPSRQFVINPNSNLILEVGDITKWSGDAIVNAANERMLGGGGVDGAIHRAAGPELLTACRAVPLERGVRCRTGQAKITAAGQLKAEFVIHTVGPVYDEWDNEDAEKLLYMSYANCLKLANNNSVSSIAFPAISTGVYGYPIKAAAQVAVRAVKDNVDAVASVYFILFDQRNYDACVAAAEALFNEPPVQQPADPAAGNSAASPATSNAASGAVVAPTANADDATTSGAPSDRGAAAAAAAFDGATATQKAEVDADDLSLTIGSGKKGVLPAVTASGKTQPETSTNKSIYLQDPGEQPSMCEEPAAIAISESAVPPPSRGDHAGVSLNVDAIGGASVDAAGGGGAGDNMSLDGDAPEASVADGVGAEGAEAVGQGLQVSPQIL